jgi:hypothetical protein
VVGIIAIILIITVKISALRYMIYFLWILVGLTTTLGFIAAGAMIGAVIATTESCWVLN